MRWLFIILAMTVQAAYSQDIVKLNEKARFRDLCFSEKIASIKLFKNEDRFSEPVIGLNSDETVTLVFDEFIRNSEPEEEYYYTVEHRDADWKESNLISSDYMSGFPENDITDIAQSQGTVIGYRNFMLSLPNENVKLKISGNYLIQVFERDSRKPALVRGFSIVEPLAAISASMIVPNNMPCMQQLAIKAGYPSLRIADAYSNLKVRVERNSGAVPDAENPVPAFVLPNSADYTRPDRNIYSGGNEYRAFDIRSLAYNGQGVARHSFENVHRVELLPDAERSAYDSRRDINGKYMIAAENYTEPDIQSEYVDVLFSFVPKMPIEGRIFLFGEFTGRSISARYEMLYIDGSYKCIVPLKQGFYNYQYVIMDKDGNLDMNATEGCFYETENVYCVYVYCRLPEDRYDRLVGWSIIEN
ncbi:MAG: DUF5103 domain-containing protein [Prevotellaceae bacterium]|jgi:hypothetical protein|nr:DUF5103 domain-containing protein [Prevotellaceae bacterium]